MLGWIWDLCLPNTVYWSECWDLCLLLNTVYCRFSAPSLVSWSECWSGTWTLIISVPTSNVISWSETQILVISFPTYPASFHAIIDWWEHSILKLWSQDYVREVWTSLILTFFRHKLHWLESWGQCRSVEMGQTWSVMCEMIHLSIYWFPRMAACLHLMRGQTEKDKPGWCPGQLLNSNLKSRDPADISFVLSWFSISDFKYWKL